MYTLAFVVAVRSGNDPKLEIDFRTGVSHNTLPLDNMGKKSDAVALHAIPRTVVVSKARGIVFLSIDGGPPLVMQNVGASSAAITAEAEATAPSPLMPRMSTQEAQM